MLDVFTLLVVLVVTHLLTTSVIYMNWRIHAHVPGVKEWAIGRILVTVALLAFALRNQLPPLPSILVGNGLLFLGSYVVYVGIRKFIGAGTPKHRPYLVAIGLWTLVIGYFATVEDSLLIRAMLSGAFTALYSAFQVVILFRYNKGRYTTAKMFQGVMAVHCLFNVSWPIGLPFLLDSNHLLGQTSAFQLYFFEGIIVSILSACIYVAMTAEYLHKDLRNQAEYDVLTNSINRRAFTPLAEHILARRAREHSPVSLMMMDLDHFKNINDTYGHQVGDEVLRQVAMTIRSTLRSQDVLCRFGGEEFIVLCPNTPSGAADQIAERIRAATAALRIQANSVSLTVTLSIGFATYPSNSKLNDLEILIQAADLALYSAKDNGRNQVARGFPQSIADANAKSSFA